MRKPVVALIFLLLHPVRVSAQEPVPGQDLPFTENELDLARARVSFRLGTELVARSEWAAALDAFEDSRRIKPHPVTQYNVAIAQRALGQYTRARRSLREAIAGTSTDKLPAALDKQATGLLSDVEAVVAHVKLSVEPKEAALAVDGRPLDGDGGGVYLAGTRTAGKGEPLGAGQVELVVDPGAHVFLFSRPGFSDVVVNKTFRPGGRDDMTIKLDTLPATLQITATQKQARVTVDGADVGFAPVDVPRPAGSYVVEVQKEGHVPFSTRVTLEPGGLSRLRAPLPIREKPLVEEWWFWTVTGAAVAATVTGVTVGTYFATREEPAEPPPTGGSLGWVIDLR